MVSSEPAKAVSALVRLAPPVASRLEEDGRRSRVPVDQLAVGEAVVVQPSESVPVDGIVEQGESTVDRSLLTGESCPVAVGIGSEVEAGTDNIPITAHDPRYGDRGRHSTGGDHGCRAAGGRDSYAGRSTRQPNRRMVCGRRARLGLAHGGSFGGVSTLVSH